MVSKCDRRFARCSRVVRTQVGDGLSGPRHQAVRSLFRARPFAGNNKMLNPTQNGIRDDERQATKVFRIISEVDVKSLLQKRARQGIGRNSFEACAVPEAAVNPR